MGVDPSPNWSGSGKTGRFTSTRRLADHNNLSQNIRQKRFLSCSRYRRYRTDFNRFGPHALSTYGLGVKVRRQNTGPGVLLFEIFAKGLGKGNRAYYLLERHSLERSTACLFPARHHYYSIFITLLSLPDSGNLIRSNQSLFSLRIIASTLHLICDHVCTLDLLSWSRALCLDLRLDMCFMLRALSPRMPSAMLPPIPPPIPSLILPPIPPPIPPNFVTNLVSRCKPRPMLRASFRAV